MAVLMRSVLEKSIRSTLTALTYFVFVGFSSFPYREVAAIRVDDTSLRDMISR